MEYEFRKKEHIVYEYDDILKVTAEEYDKLNQAYKQATEKTCMVNPEYSCIDTSGINIDGKLKSINLSPPSDIEYMMIWGPKSLSKKFKIEKI